MQYQLTAKAEERLGHFIDRIGVVLRNDKRRGSFATYAMGLLGDAERKSVEPIAARACPDPKRINAEHQRLLHFLVDSNWSDRDVRRAAVTYALPMIERRSPVESWILDDTGMMKQGSHSVGVQRQYTGTVGKIANCQIAVSLTLATRHYQLPVDFELYLPRSWTDDRARRREARIPKGVRFKTKVELGLGMIRRAVEADLPRGIVLADSFYGDSAHFRAELRKLDLHFAVGVSSNLRVWRADKFDVRRGDAIGLKDLAKKTPASAFQRITWREGTKTELSGRFAIRRVISCRADGTPPSEREAMWLVIEWEDGQSEPSKYYFSSLPQGTKKKHLVRILKERWRTERAYQDLKGELGFDHYEGRRFPGWHHHVSVVVSCFAFIAAERAIAFSPSGGPTEADQERVAARAPLPRLAHLHPPRGSPRVRGAVAPSMPVLSRSTPSPTK